MSGFHLVLGVLLLSVGSFMIVRREQIVARHQRIRTHAQPSMLWIVLGGLLALNGLLQLILAV